MLFARWELSPYSKKTLTEVFKILQHSQVRGHSLSLQITFIVVDVSPYTASGARHYDRGER